MKSKKQIESLLKAMSGTFGKELEHGEGQDIHWIEDTLRWVLEDSDALGYYYHYPEK